ncbi:MAG: hypothetical protein K2I00_02990 [Ruminococcus sp.]|nr:hypothetical protein [Ruminococcus sp.]
MENELYSLSLNLRAVAHVMHFSDYIQMITKDSDFTASLNEVVSDYLYSVSDRMLEKLSCNFSDTGFDRRAVFGSDFFDELNRR